MNPIFTTAELADAVGWPHWRMWRYLRSAGIGGAGKRGRGRRIRLCEADLLTTDEGRAILFALKKTGAM